MKKFILFDFDGVIGNTFPVALEIFGMVYPGTTASDLRTAFETNINGWMAREAQENKNHRRDIDFPTEYGKLMQSKAKIFPGIEAVIKDLSAQYNLVIISSNMSINVRVFLDTHNLTSYFLNIIGTDIHSLKTEKIKMVFDTYSVGPSGCVFITDTSGDMIEAEKMGVHAIGVSWGFHSKETLLAGKPYKIVDTPEELVPAIMSYFNMCYTNSVIH